LVKVTVHPNNRRMHMRNRGVVLFVQQQQKSRIVDILYGTSVQCMAVVAVQQEH
jgi:hypothetical protein